MRAGQLRHRLTHQRRTIAADGLGQGQETWTTAATYWGLVRGLSAKEAQIAGHLEPIADHLIVIRYQGTSGPKADDRFLFGSRAFNVVSVINTDERRFEVRLLVKEQVGG